MAKMRPRRWRRAGGGRNDAARGGHRERPEPARRARTPGAEGAGVGQGEVIARLERLESLMAAIAAHLGIEPAATGRGRVGRAGAHRGAAPAPARPEDHAVVKTVARRLSGRLKLYHAERGYGFVVSPDVPGDVFFHRSDCRIDPASLEPSSPVTFDLVEMANGQSKAVSLAPARPTPGSAEA